MAPDPASRTPPQIVCGGLSKTFGTGQGAVAAVCPFDALFPAGTTTALVGPSGCGKSTILRLIAGLETPSSGGVSIGDETPEIVRQRAGLAVAFQDPSLLPWRTVRGNVALARRLARQRRDAEAVDRLIEMVGLKGFEDRRPAALSGGMRQRAAIARCLVTEPQVLLLDEPFGAVDALTRTRLNLDLPRLWERRGATTILVTHSVTEAVLLSDRIMVLSPRPARLLRTIEVPLDRPRSEETLSDPAFAEIGADVAAALGEADDHPGKLAAQ